MVVGHVGPGGHVGQEGTSVMVIVVGQDSQGEQVGVFVDGIIVGQKLETRVIM